MVERIKPKTRVEDFAGNARIIQEHPAYGRITLTHPSGGNVEMFGSDITHNQRVALRIDLAYEEVSHGTPEYRSKPKGRLIELEMTAYQWAGLVASHSGNGVPCTLRYVTENGPGSLPLIKGQNTSEQQADAEVRESLNKMMKTHEEGIEMIRDLAAKGKATKKELLQALSLLSNIHYKLPDTVAHSIEVFKEHTEVVVAKANAEVEATLNNLVTRTGMKCLGIDNNLDVEALQYKGD